MSTLVEVDRPAVVGPERGSLREARALRGTLLPTRRKAARRRTTAADVMTRFPRTVHQGASIWTAWHRLHGTRNQHLVVVDDHQRPVGVLDERMIALEWPAGPLAPHRTPVHMLLRGQARPRVTSGEDLAVVARTMVGAGADAVPVVDRTGRLFGLVTLWHLAEVVAGQAPGTTAGPVAAEPVS